MLAVRAAPRARREGDATIHLRALWLSAQVGRRSAATAPPSLRARFGAACARWAPRSPIAPPSHSPSARARSPTPLQRRRRRRRRRRSTWAAARAASSAAATTTGKLRASPWCRGRGSDARRDDRAILLAGGRLSRGPGDEVAARGVHTCQDDAIKRVRAHAPVRSETTASRRVSRAAHRQKPSRSALGPRPHCPQFLVSIYTTAVTAAARVVSRARF